MSTKSFELTKYAKAVQSALGAIVLILTLIVGNFAFAIPADFNVYITGFIGLATTFSVYLTTNATRADEFVKDTKELGKSLEHFQGTNPLPVNVPEAV